MKAYFISGMAADSRVFRHIQLPEGYDPVFLDWIEPAKNESLPDYAMRLAARINTQEPFTLIGLSFGGMLAVEIAKHYKPVMTVLISSIPLSAHLPGYFRMAGKLRLHKLVPISVLATGAMAKRFFTRESSDDKKILWEMIRQRNPRLIRWSMQAALSWKNDWMPEQICHIHGTSDGILPMRYTRPTHTINRAGHLLVMENADMVNDILKNALR
jgi:pimeloyl-ACP methyl ester carboxylesterase